MSWSYDYDLSNPLNQARYLVGDVDAGDPQLADEEIALLLPGGALGSPTIYLAAARCCDAIASRYARQVTVKIGNVGANLTDRMETYRQKARDLRMDNLRYGGVTPFAGGMAIDQKIAAEIDSNRVAPFFTRTTGDDQGGLVGTPTADAWGYRP